jgi:hypothetical protein
VARHPDTGTTRVSHVSVRVTASDRGRIESVRGKRSISKWVREAIDEKITKEERD